MFEKVIPVSRARIGSDSNNSCGNELLIGNVDVARGRGGNGGALRALEWNELTARLAAARDLRLLMQRDSRLNIEETAFSFGDAAASYFQALEHDEQVINPDALERSKASSCIVCEPADDAATSDARDDR